MKKRYKRLTYIFPNAIEVYEYLDGRYGARGSPRKEKKKPTKEQIKRRNQWNKERKARHKLREWFKPNDYLATLTWRKNDRPGDMKEAIRILAKTLRKIRGEYRKQGVELRYLRNIEVGTKGAWHIHIIVNRIPDADLILKNAWDYGGVNFQLLYEKGEFAELAAYITKTPDTDPRLKEARYHASQNLPVPEPKEDRLVYWKKEPREKKGYYIDKETFHEGKNPVTGYRYRYYTMIRINRRI
jgi:hypothetical protein